MDIQHVVQAELEHIPRGEGPQNVLRMMYNHTRLAGYKKGGSAKQALGEALDFMRREHPDYPFAYDDSWFASQG